MAAAAEENASDQDAFDKAFFEVKKLLDAPPSADDDAADAPEEDADAWKAADAVVAEAIEACEAAATLISQGLAQEATMYAEAEARAMAEGRATASARARLLQSAENKVGFIAADATSRLAELVSLVSSELRMLAMSHMPGNARAGEDAKTAADMAREVRAVATAGQKRLRALAEKLGDALEAATAGADDAAAAAAGPGDERERERVPPVSSVGAAAREALTRDAGVGAREMKDAAEACAHVIAGSVTKGKSGGALKKQAAADDGWGDDDAW